MNLFIDGEWNSFKGELLSLALVPEQGEAFYEVLPLPDKIDPWVLLNVVAKLGKKPIEFSGLQDRLASFLNQWERVHIISDWPEDLGYLMELLVTGPGTRLTLPEITCEICWEMEAESEVPHNALMDAHANRRWWLENKKT